VGLLLEPGGRRSPSVAPAPVRVRVMRPVLTHRSSAGPIPRVTPTLVTRRPAA